MKIRRWMSLSWFMCQTLWLAYKVSPNGHNMSWGLTLAPTWVPLAFCAVIIFTICMLAAAIGAAYGLVYVMPVIFETFWDVFFSKSAKSTDPDRRRVANIRRRANG